MGEPGSIGSQGRNGISGQVGPRGEDGDQVGFILDFCLCFYADLFRVLAALLGCSCVYVVLKLINFRKLLEVFDKKLTANV